MTTFRSALYATTLALFSAGFASAQQVEIPTVLVTIENAQPGRGIFLTPPWIGIHDGSFDSYDGGQPANVPLGGNEIEALAEDGNNGPITATFETLLPNAPQVQGVAGPTGPLGPGQRASVALQVDPTSDRYFSYASMVIPSNDAFIANGNPLAHLLFDGSGNFVGQNFIVSGDETNDAGTEVNDEIAGNVAFLAQAAPNTGVTEMLPVMTPAPGFAAPGTLTYPDGVLNYPVFGNGDFNDADDRLLSVRFRFADLGARLLYNAFLDTDQEVAPDAINTGATGFAQLLSRNGNTLRIFVNTLDLSGPIMAAHLHLGPNGSNGAVVVDLAAGLLPGGTSLILNIEDADLTGPLAGGDFVDFLGEVAAGNVYVNIHTAQFPAGEIRGQVQLIQ